MALADNLSVYYSCDEASGNLLDAHAGKDLTDNNTVGAATGKVSGARDFELGSSEFFHRASESAVQFGDIDFTIAVWVQLESTPLTNMIIVGKDQDVSGRRECNLFWFQSAGRFALELFSATDSGTILQASSFGAPSTGTWYFIVAGYDAAANQMFISVNDGAVDTTSKSALQSPGAADFCVGSRRYTGFADYWDGLIDELGYWKRKLSAAEITELYNAGAGRDYAYITGGGGGTVVPVLQHNYRRRRVG